MVQGQLREAVQSKLLVAVEEVCYVLKYQILPVIPHQATATPRSKIIKTVTVFMRCLHEMRRICKKENES